MMRMMSETLLMKEIHNLQGIIDDSLQEEGDIINIHEVREQQVISSLLNSLDECRGKLQFTNSPHFYMGRISALKEALKLYGVE